MSQFEKKYTPDYYRLYPRPNYVLMLKEPHSDYNRKKNFNAPKKTRPNQLSRNSALKMRRAISWLVASAEKKMVFEKRYKKKVQWRINFITLTIPAQNETTDYKVKRLLNHWCKWAAYNCGLSNYVWKAEVQKRGDLHIHMITDCYMHHTNIRAAWNRILKGAGLLNGHSNPNSIDVHAIIDNDINDLTAYITDYMQKKGKDKNGEVVREIKGRLWGCSKKLSAAGKKFQLLDEGMAGDVHQLFQDNNWQQKQVTSKDSNGETHFMPVWLYMVTQRNASPYSYIDKDDEIAHIYANELKLIRSTNKQLNLLEHLYT